jgi:hypothetical protein
MLLINQGKIHPALLAALDPNPQPICPPYVAMKLAPHLNSAQPFQEYSFRISEAFIRTFMGPANDILVLLSLASQRGNCNGEP